MADPYEYDPELDDVPDDEAVLAQLQEIDAPPENQPKTDEEIVSLLETRIDRAMNSEDNEISVERERALSMYRGDPNGKEREGRSQIVTREVFEAVEWMLPSVMRAFMSGPRAVEFVPLNMQDEQQCKQESDIINYCALHENNGLVTFYLWMKDAALYPNGYVKVHRQEQQRRTFETFRDLSPQELIQLANNPEYTPVEGEQTGQDPMTGQPLFTIKCRREWVEAKNIWEPVPPDEMLVDGDLTCFDLDEANFLCHRTEKDFSELVREGVDPEFLESAATDESFRHNSERTNRLFYTDDSPFDTEDEDESLRIYVVNECYCWIDADNDGVAEFRKITMIGSELWENEEIDYQPFVSASYIVEAHKHAGTSLFETVRDLQEFSTALKRALLDNANDIKDPKKYVGRNAMHQEQNTLMALMNPHSRYVPTEDPSQIVPEQHQPIINELLSVIQNLDSDNQMRTGISPQLSLDPQILQQATEGAYGAAVQQASQRLEMTVRMVASSAFSKVMIKFHQLFRMYPDKERVVQVRGNYIPMDPTKWPERPMANVKVGLGYNNSQQHIATLTALLALQKEAIPLGMANPEKLWNTVDLLIEASNLGNTETFFVPPDKIPPKQPDPMQIAAMENLKADSAKKQAEAQAEMAEMQIEMAEARISAETAKNALAELMAQVENIGADTELKQAQKIKALADARNTSSGE